MLFDRNTSGPTPMNHDSLHVVILAAGAGTRMKSNRAKVLMPLAGRPLLAHVIDAARALQPPAFNIVSGHCADRKTVVSGKSVSGRVELGDRRISKKKK